MCAIAGLLNNLTQTDRQSVPLLSRLNKRFHDTLVQSHESRVIADAIARRHQRVHRGTVEALANDVGVARMLGRSFIFFHQAPILGKSVSVRRPSAVINCSRVSLPITDWKSRTIIGYGCGPATVPMM